MFNFTDFFKNQTDNLSEFGQSNGVGNVGGVSGTGNTGNGNGNGNVGGFNGNNNGGNNNGNGNTGGGFNGNGNGVGNDGEGNGETVSTFDWRSFLDDAPLNATEEAPVEEFIEVEAVPDPVAAEEVIETTMPAILQSEPTDTFEFVSTNGADNIGGVSGTGNTGIGNGNGNVDGFNGNDNGGDFNGNGNVGGGFNGNGNGNSDADVDFAAFLPMEEFQSWQDFVPDWDSFFA